MMRMIETRMRIRMMLFFCLGFSGCFQIITDPNDPVCGNDHVAKESFSFKIAVDHQIQLRLEGVDGNVEIQGIPGLDSVAVSGEKRVGSESIEDAEEYLQCLQVGVHDLSNEVFVKTSQPNQTEGRTFVVDYFIRIPQSWKALVSVINSKVTIDSLRNSVTVNNVNGQVLLSDLTGSSAVNLVNGLIQGEIYLPDNGSIQWTAVNANMQLFIPQNTSAHFSSGVVNGTIQVSNLTLHNENRTPISLTGILGTGQGTISLNTVNGTISMSTIQSMNSRK